MTLSINRKIITEYSYTILYVNPEILRYGRKAKETKRGSIISWFIFKHKQNKGDES